MRSRPTHDCSFGVTPYWRHHTLNLPGNRLLMTSFGQSCAMVVVRLPSSFRVQLFFPRQQISCFSMVGISAPWILKIFFVIFPYSMQRLLDFLGLNCICDQVASLGPRVDLGLMEFWPFQANQSSAGWTSFAIAWFWAYTMCSCCK